MSARFEHHVVSGFGYAVPNDVLDKMSFSGWELVSVTARASQWDTFCVSYWKRPLPDLANRTEGDGG